MENQQLSDFDRFRLESTARFFTKLRINKIKLSEEETEYVKDIFREELNAAKTYCELEAPRYSKNKHKLVATKAGIQGKHPFKDGWHHIAQIITEDGNTLYYTDGVRMNVDGNR